MYIGYRCIQDNYKKTSFENRPKAINQSKNTSGNLAPLFLEELLGTVQRKLTGVLSGINRKLMICHCSDGYSFFNLTHSSPSGRFRPP
jgi:hypothetical protein